MASPAPINTNDTAFSSMDQFNAAGGGSIATVNPGDKITNGVQNYRYSNDPTVFRNSTYFSGNATTSPSKVVTTSDPAATAVTNLGNNITTGANTPPVVNTGFGTVGYDPNTDPTVAADVATSQAAQKAQETQLQTERDQAIEKLKNDQATETKALGTTQANETGSTNRNLLYMQQGGQSASAQAYLNKLADTHQTEMSALSAKYTTAIQQAQNAFTDKDFALAQTYAAAAKQIKQDALDRNQKFIDTTLKIAQAQREEQTQQLQQQQQQMTFNKDNKVTSRFYQYPGSPAVFDSTTGNIVSADQYAALGGVGTGGKYKDIQVIDPHANDPHSSAYVEWQDYASTGGKLGFNDYQTYDANRKARAAASAQLSAAQQLNQSQAKTVNDTLTSLEDTWKLGNKYGTDGKVSPEDYNKAKAKFDSSMKNYLDDPASYFDKAMAPYVNRQYGTYKNDYAIGTSN